MSEVRLLRILCKDPESDVVYALDVVGEPVGEFLAITPVVRSRGFTGGWTVTHVPTGHRIVAFPFDLCISHARAAARLLAAHPVDWSMTEIDQFRGNTQASEAAGLARALGDECHAGPCVIPAPAAPVPVGVQATAGGEPA